MKVLRLQNAQINNRDQKNFAEVYTFVLGHVLLTASPTSRAYPTYPYPRSE